MMTDTGSPGSLGRFLTLVDVAEVLNISTGAAYALVRSGELPAIKVGGRGHWRIERSVLESYIDAKYEETRRRGLWREASFTDLAEPSFGSSHDRPPFTDPPQPGAGGLHALNAPRRSDDEDSPP